MSAQIIYEGKPLKNVKVAVFDKAAEDTQNYVTDDDGKISFEAKSVGEYLVVVRYADASKAVEDEYDEVMNVMSQTFECAE